MADDFIETAEEQFVLVEFAGNTGSDALNQENVSMRVLGIETEQPIIQIGNQLYHGKYYDTIGTELFFNEIEAEPPSDPLFSVKLDKKLQLYGKTNTKLVISRAFAKPIVTQEECIDTEQVEATVVSMSDN